mmetsp:Transcript_17467/g.41126  ORF Transcript_17467/g.41126 Transcript_17467/m.41126 type:complete len:355 (+) Transcript_17467:544-1608(+)
MVPLQRAFADHRVNFLNQLLLALRLVAKEGQEGAHGSRCRILPCQQEGENIGHNHVLRHALARLRVHLPQHQVQKILRRSFLLGAFLVAPPDYVSASRLNHPHILQELFPQIPAEDGPEEARPARQRIDGCVRVVHGLHKRMNLVVVEAPEGHAQATNSDGFEGHFREPGFDEGLPPITNITLQRNDQLVRIPAVARKHFPDAFDGEGRLQDPMRELPALGFSICEEHAVLVRNFQQIASHGKVAHVLVIGVDVGLQDLFRHIRVPDGYELVAHQGGNEGLQASLALGLQRPAAQGQDIVLRAMSHHVEEMPHERPSTWQRWDRFAFPPGAARGLKEEEPKQAEHARNRHLVLR